MTCERPHTVVTGASSGIGRATALRLAAAGQHVYAGVRREADGGSLRSAAAAVHGRGGPGDGEITPLMLDVTEAGQVAAAAAAVSAHTARLDGLVNNAGVGLACPAELLPLDAFRRLTEVNVTGQLAVTQAFLPLLRRAQGRIVVIGTVGVRFGPPFAGALDATKAALTALADALRQELAPWRIRVVVVEPASIASSAAGKVAADAASVMASAPAAGRALYGEAFGRMLATAERRESGGSSPDVAAATVARALTVARPRSVYLCGRFARRLALLSRLPTPVGDAARRRVFGLPAPGALADAQPG